MDVTDYRQALLDAVNTHNLDSVRALVHPVYVARTRAGAVRMDVRQMLEVMDGLFRSDPGYRETLRIESIRVLGGRARLSTCRAEQPTHSASVGGAAEVRRLETWLETDSGWVLLEERDL